MRVLGDRLRKELGRGFCWYISLQQHGVVVHDSESGMWVGRARAYIPQGQE